MPREASRVDGRGRDAGRERDAGRRRDAGRGRDVGRRLAQQAWQVAWPQVQRRLPERAVPERLLPPDERLARRMGRDAESARRVHAAALAAHAAAVARRERVLRRSRRAVPGGLVVAGGSTAAALVPAVSAGAPVLWVLAAAGGTRALIAVQRLRRPPALPAAPPPVTVPPPPHSRSAAFPAVRRLEQVRWQLQSLVPLVAPVGRETAEQAWAAAADADHALRWQAARLAAAEPHTGVDAALLAHLEAGVSAQERLVHAVADLVGASGHPHDAERLQDVTDRLHGLAAGLRELR